MRSHEAFSLAENVTGASLVPVVSVIGGLYKALFSGTVGTSKIEIQNRNGDWVAAGAAIVSLVAQDIYLPPGKVRANMGAGATNAFVDIIRVPLE